MNIDLIETLQNSRTILTREFLPQVGGLYNIDFARLNETLIQLDQSIDRLEALKDTPLYQELYKELNHLGTWK